MQMGGADQYTKAMEARNRSEGWWDIYQIQKISHLQQKEKKKKMGKQFEGFDSGGGGGVKRFGVFIITICTIK